MQKTPRYLISYVDTYTRFMSTTEVVGSDDQKLNIKVVEVHTSTKQHNSSEERRPSYFNKYRMRPFFFYPTGTVRQEIHTQRDASLYISSTSAVGTENTKKAGSPEDVSSATQSHGGVCGIKSGIKDVNQPIESLRRSQRQCYAPHFL